MTIKEVITKAIEGGWKPRSWDFGGLGFHGVQYSKVGLLEAVFSDEQGENGIWREYNMEVILLDPLFWQSLGKSMGFEKRGTFAECKKCQREIENPEPVLWVAGAYRCIDYKGEVGCGGEMKKREVTEDWKYYWHRFIDHLAEGKSIEDYFKLLTAE